MKKCNHCGSEDVRVITYGYAIDMNEELELGGCIISPMSSKYRCRSCKEEFGLQGTTYVYKEDGEIKGVLNRSFKKNNYEMYDLTTNRVLPTLCKTMTEAANKLSIKIDDKSIWKKASFEEEVEVAKIIQKYFLSTFM